MFYMDPTYAILIPGLLVSLWAQCRVDSVTRKYARVSARCGLTGAELAQRLLHEEGIDDVTVERIGGNLTDHYDPSTRTLRLSQGVADSTSLTALGVAAHETGHALQHRDAYKPLVLRTAVVPTVNIGSNLSWPLFLIGLIFNWQPLITLGIVFFLLTVLFTLITLPVEFNASKRADDGALVGRLSGCGRAGRRGTRAQGGGHDLCRGGADGGLAASPAAGALQSPA